MGSSTIVGSTRIGFSYDSTLADAEKRRDELLRPPSCLELVETMDDSKRVVGNQGR